MQNEWIGWAIVVIVVVVFASFIFHRANKSDGKSYSERYFTTWMKRPRKNKK